MSSDAPTITPIASLTLKPSANKLEAAVQEVVLTPARSAHNISHCTLPTRSLEPLE